MHRSRVLVDVPTFSGSRERFSGGGRRGGAAGRESVRCTAGEEAGRRERDGRGRHMERAAAEYVSCSPSCRPGTDIVHCLEATPRERSSQTTRFGGTHLFKCAQSVSLGQTTCRA